MEKWRAEHPEDAAKLAEEQARAAEQAKPGAQPEEEPVQAPKPAEEPVKPADKPAEAVTPQAMDELLANRPALKAALEADPEARGVIMETARRAEAARPILDLIPTPEEAQFVVSTSGKFLDLQHKFAMSAERPEYGEQAFNDLVDLFKARDEKGEVVTRDGHPVMNESFDFLTGRLTTGAIGGMVDQTAAQLADLEKKVASAVYPDEASKQRDQEALDDTRYKKAALEYVAELLKGEVEGDQLPELPADATPAQREFQEKLKAQQEALKSSSKGAERARRVADRKAFELEVNATFGAGVGEFVDNVMKTRRDAGEYIPDFILERKWINPATNQETKFPDFAVRVMNAFVAKINSIPSVASKLRDYELQGRPAKDQRLAYFGELRGKYLPAIIDSELAPYLNGIRQMSAASSKKQGAVAEIARVEPQGVGSAPTPAAMTREQLETKARENLAQNPDYQGANRQEQYEMFILELERLKQGK